MNSNNNISGFTLAAGILGLIAGLVISALVSIPISNLPGWMGSILPFFIYALLGLIGLLLGIAVSICTLFTVNKAYYNSPFREGN